MLQDSGRARIFGQPTAGCANAATIAEFSDGSAMSITVARLLAGPLLRAVDGPGVTPDEAAPLGGGDTALDIAVRYLSGRAAVAP